MAGDIYTAAGSTAISRRQATDAAYDPTVPVTTIPGASDSNPVLTEAGVPESSGTTTPSARARRVNQASILRAIQWAAVNGQLPMSSSTSALHNVVFQAALSLGLNEEEATAAVTGDLLQQVYREMRVRFEIFPVDTPTTGSGGKTKDSTFDQVGDFFGGGGSSTFEQVGNFFGGGSEAGGDTDIAPRGGQNSYGGHEIWSAPWQQMSQEQFNVVQQMVYDAGYYGPDSEPVWGDRSDPFFREAWFGAVQDLYAQGNTLSMDEFLAQKAQHGGPAQDPIQFESQVVQLTDAAAIRTQADQVSQGIMGRKLNDAEKANLVGIIHALEMQSATEGIDIQTNDQLMAAGMMPNDLATVNGTITPEMVTSMSDQLAAQYGLSAGGQWRTPEENFAIYGYVRDSDHLRGMARDISGTPEQMAALAAWASANEGPGKLFRWVGYQDDANHFDHVHLSFNEYVGEGAISGVAAGASGGEGQIDQFMAAMRTVESGGDYGVTNGIGAYGAYQFMPGTWQTAANMAGIDPSDRSPGAQDAAARALMLSYWRKYRDWRLVAAAWHGGEGLADDALANGMDYLRSVGDGNISTYDYIQRVMGNMTGVTGQLGPSITGIESVDLQAQLEEQLRERFPTETGAHDVATQFDTFSQMAFGGGSSA